MPIFEFKCNACGHKFEELLFSSALDPKTIRCPACGKNESEKLMSAFSSAAGGQSATTASSCGTGGFT
jgi:putative FmdB family regulatory protein